MKRAPIIPVVASAILLGCLCTSTTGADKPFQPLLDHLAKQHGLWGSDNTKVAAAFYRCFDAIPKDKEKALIEFVGNDNDRAYWISSYLTSDSYLHGHAPMPHLALAIRANASDRLAVEKNLTDDNLSTRHCLNYLAAIQAKRLGLDALAVKFKVRAAAGRDPGGPAVSGDDRDVYDSIKINKGQTTNSATKEEGSEPEDNADQEPPLVLQAYDLGDLLFEAPSPAKRIDELGDGRTVDATNFPFSFPQPYYGSGMIGQDYVNRDNRDAPKSSIAAAKSDAYTQLTDAISTLISPEDWDQVGGQSSLQVLGDLLLVRTTKENHRKIASLLDVVRQRAAARKIVSVEVHWLWLSEDELHRLAPVSAEKEDGRHAAQLTVDDAAWNRLAQERAKEENDVRPGYQAIVTCLNGQTVVVAAGRQSRFIVTMIPVVGDGVMPTPAPPTPVTSPYQSSGISGYQPTTTTIQEGPAVEIRPILCGKNQVLLDIHSRVFEVQTREGGGEARANPPAANAQANVVRELAAAVDRPQVSTHRVDTTLRAPLGRRVLAGGITYGSEPEPGNRSLYVFIKAVLCEPQDAVAAPKTKR